MSTRRQIQEWVSKRLAILVAVVVASFAVVLWQALIAHEHAQITLTVEQEANNLRIEIKERLDPQINALERLARAILHMLYSKERGFSGDPSTRWGSRIQTI